VVRKIEKMNDTRLWETLDEGEIKKLYGEAGSITWLRNAVEYLLSRIEELKKQ